MREVFISSTGELLEAGLILDDVIDEMAVCEAASSRVTTKLRLQIVGLIQNSELLVHVRCFAVYYTLLWSSSCTELAL